MLEIVTIINFNKYVSKLFAAINNILKRFFHKKICHFQLIYILTAAYCS